MLSLSVPKSEQSVKESASTYQRDQIKRADHIIMLETYLRRGIMQYKSFGAFFARPIFDVFFFIAIGVLVWTVTKELKAYKAKKQAA